jgi:K+-transporting ATPase ATPase A chain
MTFTAIVFVVFIVGATALLSWPVGRYMKWAMDPVPAAGAGPNGWTRGFAAIGGPLARKEQDWKQYLFALLAFNAVSFTVTFLILALQQYLPFNPDGKGELEGSLIFNTAASFTSNTNLQHYSGEVSLSYASQLGALMWQQFVSAATGIAALVALARGLSGRANMGNFFVDLQRAAFLVLLPVALILAGALALGGVPMTLDGAAAAPSSPSSNSAPMAAASLGPSPPTRSRTRPSGPTSSRRWRSSSSRWPASGCSAASSAGCGTPR